MTILEKLSQHFIEIRKMGLAITKGDEERADNLIQEFFLYMGERPKSSKINLKGDFDTYKNYIFICLKNLNIDIQKKENRGQFGNLDDYPAVSNGEDNAIDFEERQMNEESKDEMLHFINHFLKQGYKTKTINYKVGLLQLNYLQGMSMREISNTLGITTRHVQTSIENVRKIIKEEYYKDGKAK